ncbi:MAG: hypothetical protein NZ611_04385, partial [Bacteroidia bacterium]|nr:hypothetical protein [Bacteroidia bacterium]
EGEEESPAGRTGFYRSSVEWKHNLAHLPHIVPSGFYRSSVEWKQNAAFRWDGTAWKVFIGPLWSGNWLGKILSRWPILVFIGPLWSGNLTIGRASE